MKIRIKTFNGETINTRDQARKAVQAVKEQLSGKYLTVKLSDNKTGNQRWGYTIENTGSKTLSVSRKQKGNMFASMEHETAHNALQWKNDNPTKMIPVYIKSTYSRKMIHC